MNTAVVIVTYNRIKDLKETLDAWERQTAAPALVMVVDNCSTDGTAEYLRDWAARQAHFEHRVYTMTHNAGGSGGFQYGMERALETDADWVFVADDDAVPRPDMLEKLEAFCQTHLQLLEQTAAVCTAVHNLDHNSGIHRCIGRKSPFGYLETYVPESWYQKEFFEFDLYSFVGTMIKMSVLRKAGVARGDFFIYNDDYEHAVRVRQYGKLICVPASVMDHVDNLTYAREATWRDYYGTRNGVLMHRIHFGWYAAFWRAMRRLLVAAASLNRKKFQIIRAGIRDGFRGKTGIHPVYNPSNPDWRPRH